MKKKIALSEPNLFLGVLRVSAVSFFKPPFCPPK
jgi:hypothetical protein